MDATEDIHTGLMDFGTSTEGGEEGAEKKEGGGWLDTIKETYEGIKGPMDANEVREIGTSKDANNPFSAGEKLDGAKPTGLGKGLGILNAIVDTYKTGKGLYETGEGVNDGNLDKGLEGTHDLLEGGSGLLGNMDNQVGALAKSFGLGFSAGDAIAPTIFGKEGDGANAAVKDKNGQYYGHTGASSIDSMIDGGHEISNGDYLDGAWDITKGAVDGESTVLNPASLLAKADPERMLDLGEKSLSTVEKGINPFGGLAQKAGESIGNGIVGLLKDDDE